MKMTARNIASIFLGLLIFGLSAISMAQPAQRVIIMFDTPLSDTESETMLSEISDLKPCDTSFEKAEHSSASRWVLIMKPTLSEAALNKFIESVKTLDNIRWVEEDIFMHLQKPGKSLN